MIRNQITQVMDTAFVEMYGGQLAVIDASDIPLVEPYRWSFQLGYAVSQSMNIPMHRFILGAQRDDRRDTDHINRDPLDNRRCNLRLVTRNQNEHNKGIRRNNTSGYIGVCWDKSKGRWMAFCKRDYKFVCIGRFEEKEDAAHAYDRWVIANRDEIATTNFPRSHYANWKGQ